MTVTKRVGGNPLRPSRYREGYSCPSVGMEDTAVVNGNPLKRTERFLGLCSYTAGAHDPRAKQPVGVLYLRVYRRPVIVSPDDGRAGTTFAAQSVLRLGAALRRRRGVASASMDIWFNAVAGFFLRNYGLSNAVVGFLANERSFIGSLLQPFTGALSDRLTWRWGRRKPFMLFIVLVAAGFVLLTGNPPLALVGSGLCDRPHLHGPGYHRV